MRVTSRRPPRRGDRGDGDRGGSPTASSARCASRAVDPVVTTSSHTTTCAARPASRRPAPARPRDSASSGARWRPGRRRRAPAWSAAPRETSSGATADRPLAAHPGRGAPHQRGGRLVAALAPGPGPRRAPAPAAPAPPGSRPAVAREHGVGQQLAQHAAVPPLAAVLVAHDERAHRAVVRLGGPGRDQPVGHGRRPRDGALASTGPPRHAVAQHPTGRVAPDAAAAEEQVEGLVEHPSMPAAGAVRRQPGVRRPVDQPT